MRRKKEAKIVPAIPRTELARRIGRIVSKRRDDTLWSVKEIRAYRIIYPHINLSDVENLERMYRTLGPPGEGNYLRRRLETLLNNWGPDCELANNWCEKNPLKKIRKVIPMILPSEGRSDANDPEEKERVARFEEERARRKGT